ncbi:MAG: ATP-binding protein, partial [Clostridium sp.]
RMEVLLETNKKLQKARSIMDIIENISSQIIKLLGRDVVIYPVKDKDLQDVIVYRAENSKTVEESYCTQDERAVATWVFKNIQSAGASTDTLPGSKGLYVPLYADKDVFAVIGIVMEGYEEIDPFEKSLLNAMLSESASAMERYHLNEAQKQIALKAQRESLRSNLLRAISHDLRTPLTCISGNANVLMGSGENMDEKIKQTLYEDIYDDSLWLINLVENLLSVTRIENGSMDIEMQPEFWEEVITEALKHVNRKKSSHNIIVEVEDEMLMSKMHPRLIIQVIINIVDNGIKYTDEGSTITISARRDKGRVAFEVADDGSGISQKDKERLFDMFFTLDKNKGDSRRGLGLGLSLCKSIINAHEGDIYVRDNIPRGTIFGFKLPLEEVLLNENTDFSS